MLLLMPMSSFARTVNIMVIAIHGVEIGKKEWQPTVDYLQQTLPQHEFHLIPITPIDLPYIKELVGRQKVDFVITQPAIYVGVIVKSGV